ncbi:MAG: branched-chain amino acid ABC transporter permease [Chloroflexota bacterium]|nr:branched-chain amino acid ABC transporter permease [Chloroflexota bacterium]MDE2929403.1 branched-chain amino acid ABC transporter permease [Chloroflexota bacterium]
MIAQRPNLNNTLAIALTAAAAVYVGWKISQSPEQAVQFAFNGLSVGAVYALLAIGFTLVYSTVWFFDLYYGAAAAIGAYGVFYLRSQETLGGLYAVNSIVVNVIFAAVTAGVVAWALYESVYPRFRARVDRSVLFGIGGVLAAGTGVYTGFLLTNPKDLHINLSPVIALGFAVLVTWLLYQAYQGVVAARVLQGLVVITGAAAAALGVYFAYLIANAPDAKLYLSWGVSCMLAGVVGLAFYRGLYVYMRARSQSPLIMLVASLGILLAITALTSIVFESTPRPLPEALGNDPWTFAGATIKGFNVFTVGVALVGFLFLLYLLKFTSFGKSVRAIGDDEEVSKVVGINTTTVIAVVFFIGAVYAAMAGLLSGHDTAIQPRMGLLLLLKGWIASVVGGIGNLYGAIVGGFVLGMIEQFGIWDLAGEWRDVISFVLLILFLSFWPKGLLPRK